MKSQKVNNNLDESLGWRRNGKWDVSKASENYDRVNMVKMCLLAVHKSVFVNAILQTLLITIFMRKKVRRWSRRMKNKKMIFHVWMKNKMNRARRDKVDDVFGWNLREICATNSKTLSHETTQFICFAVDMRNVWTVESFATFVYRKSPRKNSSCARGLFLTDRQKENKNNFTN